MKHFLLLCALCFTLLLLAACGQLDIAMLEATPDAGPTVISAMTQDTSQSDPEPTATRVSAGKESPQPTDRPAVTPTPTNTIEEASESDEAQDGGQSVLL